MQISQTISELRAPAANWRRSRMRIVFVPTMGNLHAGHMRLVEAAREYGDVVVASIYVNPMQFGPDEDLAAYPRTLPADQEKLRAAGVDLLFLPSDREIYPRGLDAQTYVDVPVLSEILCGAMRPGHFRGVATVVNRLLNLVSPDVALFGKKDYQQWLVIRRMVDDLGMPIEIVGVDTVREPSGLALSSRNSYLVGWEQEAAPKLYQILCDLRTQLIERGDAVTSLEADAIKALQDVGFRVDYLSVRRQQDLALPHAEDRELVILVAAWLGKARLIDNVELSLNRKR